MKLEELETMAKGMPKIPCSDWRGTNHFEITDSHVDAESYWFLHMRDALSNGSEQDDETESGKRVGLVMDLACVAPKLIARIKTLEAALKDIRTNTVKLYEIADKALEEVDY